MSMTENTRACSAGVTFRPGPVYPAGAGHERPAGGDTLPAFASRAGAGLLHEFDVHCRLNGIEIRPEEYRELRILAAFLAYHIHPDGSADVQCMRVWNEWIRMLHCSVSGFPCLIREKELRQVMTELFGVRVVRNTVRGAVYPGLRFVP